MQHERLTKEESWMQRPSLGGLENSQPPSSMAKAVKIQKLLLKKCHRGNVRGIQPFTQASERSEGHNIAPYQGPLAEI